MTTIYWVSATLILLVIEAFTLGLTTIWFAIGTLLATVCSALGLPVWFQFTVFVVGSLASILCIRPIATRMLKVGKERTNADRVIGELGVVTQAIDNIAETGLVHIEGQTWTARSDDGEPIAEGEQVLAVRIAGVKLFVTPAK